MTYNVINNKAFALTETFQQDGRTYISVSFVEIIDYELYKDRMVEKATVKQIIEVEKYIKGQEYISVERTFERNIPASIVSFINIIRQRNGQSPVT
jgi:hypothetical protein